jgi:hypothetical protein
MNAVNQRWNRVRSIEEARALCLRERVTHLQVSRASDRDFSPLAECPDLTHLIVMNCRYLADL